MLDYSDEELEAESIRRRNSPSEVDSRIHHQRPRDLFRRGEDDFSLGAVAKAQSIFKRLKERSSIMPLAGLPTHEAFIINEFIPDKNIPPKSKLQNFEVGLGGNHSIFEKPEQEDDPNSFFKSMSTAVFLAQFFAVLPVSGIRGPNYKSLYFKWVHYKTAYWALSFMGTFFLFICSTTNNLDKGTLTQAASGIIYFGCGVLSSILMLLLSRNWRQLNKQFALVEFKLKRYGYPKKINLKFKIFTVLILLVALVEHLLSKAENIEIAVDCTHLRGDFSSFAELYFLNEYSEIFSNFSYSLWKGFLIAIAHFIATANWNFKDVFLCLISWTIAERFQQVHDLLDKVHGHDKQISFWREVREDYNNLSVLTKRVDSYIQKLMFLSIGNNLFFICIQLFHSLRKKINSFKLLYFFWSFGFLVMRTGFVAFSAARINEESKEPKTVCYSVPQKNYTAEVRRFLTQLTTNEVALTGGGFFSITRSLILTISGTVITYEIVLVQFGGNEAEDDLPKNGSLCVK